MNLKRGSEYTGHGNIIRNLFSLFSSLQFSSFPNLWLWTPQTPASSLTLFLHRYLFLTHTHCPIFWIMLSNWQWSPQPTVPSAEQSFSPLFKKTNLSACMALTLSSHLLHGGCVNINMSICLFSITHNCTHTIVFYIYTQTHTERETEVEREREHTPTSCCLVLGFLRCSIR